MALYLLRHGETAWTLDRRHTGTTDLPLTVNGEEQARTLGSRLEGVVFARVLSSPLRRALVTAELSGVRPQAQLAPSLVEFDYGEYEGITTEEILKIDPDWDLWRDGCPGGESSQQVLDRCRGVLEALDPQPDQNYAVFAHGHVLRALAVVYLGLPVDVCRHLIVKVASISILDMERDTRAIEAWNLT